MRHHLYPETTKVEGWTTPTLTTCTRIQVEEKVIGWTTPTLSRWTTPTLSKKEKSYNTEKK
jgi:hypothetical protein